MCLEVFGFFIWLWNIVHPLDCHAEGWNNKPGIKDFSVWRWTDQSSRGAESPAARNCRAWALHRVWESTAGTSSATSAGFTTGNQFSKAVWKTPLPPPKFIFSLTTFSVVFLKGKALVSFFAHVFSCLQMCSVLVVVRILTGRLKSLKIFHDFSPSFVNKKD